MNHDDGREVIAQENCGQSACQASVRQMFSPSDRSRDARQRKMSIDGCDAAVYAARREYHFKAPPNRVM